jgi:hypothetical protein
MKAFPLMMIVAVCLGVCLANDTEPGRVSSVAIYNGKIDGLRAEDRRVCASAAAAIEAEQDRLVAQLQQIVRETIRHKEKAQNAAQVLQLLGRLRAVEAVPLLVENLGCPARGEEEPRKASVGEGKWSVPVVAAYALAEIGLPAVDPVLERLFQIPQQALSDSDFRLAGTVIGRALGKDAVPLVKHRIREEEQPVKRDRLTRLLSDVERSAIGKMESDRIKKEKQRALRAAEQR